jgi:hypothetical protein
MIGMDPMIHETNHGSNTNSHSTSRNRPTDINSQHANNLKKKKKKKNKL